ncbi:MAG TPA: hypothetical protein K8V48_05840 [Limosilactobacillus oris]|uniref:hypothetical protein n=1 Tax=Limosilactobacillus oris TaxID=1632 RepID=UPI001DECEF9B|nr:hypothetical protein [Limosilactobacillus oris]HJF47482.1 hypothetical protein [Limosilactobacillus oris]
MTTEEVNHQYQPIDQLIDSIPEDTVTGEDGVEYGKPGFLLKLRLMMVIHHCKNMKLSDTEFPPPFSKSELAELVAKPYTKAKLKRAKELQERYRLLDDKAQKKGDRVA